MGDFCQQKMANDETLEQDEQLALILQEQFFAELNEEGLKSNDEVASLLPTHSQLNKKLSPNDNREYSIVAPEWEDLDPNPDLHVLFMEYNQEFFYNKLMGCEVKWSPRMTLCAGVCSYQYRTGFCSIRLSLPLLKLRPRKDLVETLLHEMIHAYLFVTDGNDDHDGHGPAFHQHMRRINAKTGTSISVYHNFHDEVDSYRTHWWKCDGPCQHQRPFYGIVKRSMNRAPGSYDRWWNDHGAKCGGTFIKIKEPENFGKKKSQSKKRPLTAGKGQPDIKSFVGKMNKSEKPTTANIFGFGGTSYAQPSTSKSGLMTQGKSGAVTVNPGWKVSDNSNKGSVIKKSKSITSSKSDTRTDDSNVSATVRDIWAKKFAAPSATAVKEAHKENNKTVTTSSNDVHCPVCNLLVPAQDVNSHLDTCLAKSDESKADRDKLSNVEDNPFVLDEDSTDGDIPAKLSCPVCFKLIFQEEMNRHLDFCAT